MGVSVSSLGNAAFGTARGALRMVEAAAQDAVGAFDLLNVTGANGQPDDPFDARDPDYIRTTLPALRSLSDVYFRADVSGLDRIPTAGRCCWSGTTRAGP
jgi:hypothetical protein